MWSDVLCDPETPRIEHASADTRQHNGDPRCALTGPSQTGPFRRKWGKQDVRSLEDTRVFLAEVSKVKTNSWAELRRRRSVDPAGVGCRRDPRCDTAFTNYRSIGCRMWCLAVGLVLFQVSGREEVSLGLGWGFRKSWNDPLEVFIAGAVTKFINSWFGFKKWIYLHVRKLHMNKISIIFSHNKTTVMELQGSLFFIIVMKWMV